MRPRTLLIVPVLTALVLVFGLGAVPRAGAGSSGFASEQPAGTPLKHQSNWEPTVRTDPNHPASSWAAGRRRLTWQGW